MELLLELQDMERFRRADQLADYVGLLITVFSADKYVFGELRQPGRTTYAGRS